MSGYQRAITLRRLLSMSAGFTDEQTGSRPANGKVASILKLPLQADRLAGS
jgi:CubicO group peptidase (beta-lactamase class C family)